MALFASQSSGDDPNPNSFRFSGLVQAAQLGSVLASPHPRLGRVQLPEFYPSLDAPTNGEQEENLGLKYIPRSSAVSRSLSQ